MQPLRILVTLAVLCGGVAGSAAAGPAGAADPPEVVRIGPVDPAVVPALRVRIDVWGVDRQSGELLALVDADGRAWLERAGHRFSVDADRTAELAKPWGPIAGQSSGIPGFPCYRTVDETYAALEALATANPALASWNDFGDTWEKIHGPVDGFDLFDLVLTNTGSLVPKAPVVLMSAMHARELATAELLARFAEELVAGYGTDPDATWLLDHSEVHVVTQLNPDGRVQAEAGLSWRKNRNDDQACLDPDDIGVDLNRNSTFEWGGGSPSACSETYRGPSAASEPETVAFEALMDAVFSDQRGGGAADPAPDTATGVMLSVHSAGGIVFYPWEHSNVTAPNEGALRTLARKFGFFTGYAACQNCFLGPAAGTSVDQAYGELGVAAYTFEIGTTFFQDCASFESTVLPDNLPALRYAAKAARRPYLEPGGPEVVDAVVTPVDPETVTIHATADDTRSASNGFGDEPTQAIASAAYSVDTPHWLGGVEVPLAASDGVFDETVEQLEATIDLTALWPGRRLIFVAATDASGARGVPTAVFVTAPGEPLFDDGFELGDPGAWDGEVP